MTGEGTLNRAPFKAVIHGAPLLNVDATQPYPFTLDVRAGATHVAATGAITHPFDFARITAKASFSGNDLANLYYLTGLTLPNTPAYSVTGDLSRDGELYRYNRLAGRIGHSDLSGSLSVDDSGDRPLLTADARSRYVNFDDLGFLFGGGKGRDTAPKAPAASTAPAKSGEITVADAPQPRTLLLPDAPLQIDRVRQMDAKVRYMADRIESRDLPLRRLSLNLTLRNGVLTLDPVSATFVHGRIDGTARIDASRDVPVSAVDLRLRDIALQQFLARQNPPALEGTVEARARLTGTGDTVHKAASTANGTLTVVVPHGQVRKAFAELMGVDLLNGGWALLTNDKSPTQLRCMVASFDAHDGVLSTRRLTFDTDVVTATGHGTVDLRNETLDLTLNGQPKKLRIGRIKAPLE
ncbi:MAG: AsmA family protein, partial [Gemmatimonadaceae bacterium]